MGDAGTLERELSRIDGRGYRAYKDLRGRYRLDHFDLHIDHVQGDPFASPSRLCVEIDRREARLDPALDPSPSARLALEDFLGRAFARAIGQVTGQRRGSRGMGHSGLIEIDAGGQQVLRRSAVVVGDDSVQVRFVLGLPARGRSVLGRQAAAMLLDEVPDMVECSLLGEAIDEHALGTHIEVVEDWFALQAALAPRGLVAFVADGAILPRRSGVDPRPAVGPDVTPWSSPAELAVELPLAGGGQVRGTGIPQGVTLVVGGGFHGKSTLLDALALGIYPHVPGDGRQQVVARAGVVKVRAEDGRRVEAVDISPFIDNLPHHQDTARFCTDNASGSTSQAASIIEAIEMGAEALLIDEDTSATNFMVRDRRMQQLVAKDREPITPFIDRVRELWSVHGCSTVLVVGGCGDYFEVADTVLQMDEYRPADVTDRARQIAQAHPSGRAAEPRSPLEAIRPRRPRAGSFDPRKGKREVSIGARGLDEILFGRTAIDLDALEQLVDVAQTRAIGELILLYATRYLEPRWGMREGIEQMMRDLAELGLDEAARQRRGDLAEPRSFEVAAAINRMRTLTPR